MKILISERLSQHKFKTPEGYLICQDAILARTGKQSYKRYEVFGDSCADADNDVEIDRKYEEVFSPATLASFENKPVTVEHPNEDVNVDNYKDYAVGFVRDVKQGKTANGEDVILGTLVITDAQTIEEIENGEHTDLSCGYDCDIVDEDNPQQRNIRGNHVALCQQGRAGIARIVDSVKDSDSLASTIKNLTQKIKSINSNISRNDAISFRRDIDKEFDYIKKLFEIEKVDIEYFKELILELKNTSERLDDIMLKQYLSQMANIMNNWMQNQFDVKDSVKDGTHNIKAIIFESDKNYSSNTFTDLIDDGDAKLYNNEYIKWWHDGKTHQEVANKLPIKGTPMMVGIDEVAGKIEIDTGGNTKFNSYVPELRKKATQFYHGTNDSAYRPFRFSVNLPALKIAIKNSDKEEIDAMMPALLKDIDDFNKWKDFLLTSDISYFNQEINFIKNGLKSLGYTLPIKDSVKDASKEDIQFLIDDEYEAVRGYEKILAKARENNDEPAIEKLQHILGEEMEHIQELKDLLENDKPLHDSVKDDAKWISLEEMEKKIKSNKKASDELEGLLNKGVGLGRATVAVYRKYFDPSYNDSIKDNVGVDWFRELSSNNVQFSFIKGGYGMQFKNKSDYDKAKVLAKKVGLTSGHWYDNDLQYFEYSSTRISNEDSMRDERLSPMTYKKLREVGYDENDWENWTQEEANARLASREKENKENKRQKEISSKESKFTETSSFNASKGNFDFEKNEKILSNETIYYGKLDSIFDKAKKALIESSGNKNVSENDVREYIQKQGLYITKNNSLIIPSDTIMEYQGESNGYPSFKIGEMELGFAANEDVEIKRMPKSKKDSVKKYQVSYKDSKGRNIIQLIKAKSLSDAIKKFKNYSAE